MQVWTGTISARACAVVLHMHMRMTVTLHDDMCIVIVN